MVTAIYAGSFDVFTKGHSNIAAKACLLFDRVIILVCDNKGKQHKFSLADRANHIKECFNVYPASNLEVRSTDGLVMDFANQFTNARLIRGIRNTTDMVQEMQLADINKQFGNVETVFIPCNNEYRNISSSLVKELVAAGKDVSELVPPYINKMLQYYK